MGAGIKGRPHVPPIRPGWMLNGKPLREWTDAELRHAHRSPNYRIATGYPTSAVRDEARNRWGLEGEQEARHGR